MNRIDLIAALRWIASRMREESSDSRTWLGAVFDASREHHWPRSDFAALEIAKIRRKSK